MLYWSKTSSAPRPESASALARAREAVLVQPAEIDALLEIHLHAPRRLQRALPAVAGIGMLDHRFGEGLSARAASSGRCPRP